MPFLADGEIVLVARGYKEMSSMSPNAGGGCGDFAGSQPMSTAVHRSPNKLWRSNSMFNLWLVALYKKGITSLGFFSILILWAMPAIQLHGFPGFS